MTIPQAFALALQHHQAGRLADAEALYRQILAEQPHHAEALHHLGLIAHQVGRYELAIDLIRRSIVLEPNRPDAHSNLGEANRRLGRLDAAIESYRQALRLRPDHPEIHHNLGLALLEQGELDEAIAHCRRALQFKTNHPEAYYNLGTALARQQRFEEAITSFQRALELKPDYPEALHNLGSALTDQDQTVEAVAAFSRALELRPNDPDAHNNLSAALAEQGHYEKALASARRALELRPEDGTAQLNLSLQLLLRGDYERGWPLFEARWAAGQSVERDFSQPRWDGSALHGQRILLHAEQGYGDSIQFIRYAPLVAQRGGVVVVEWQPSLVELFRSVEGVNDVVAAGAALPLFDWHLPMLSLPLVFGTMPGTIPNAESYLCVDPARREVWRKRVGVDRSRLRVGLAWTGNPNIIRRQKRHVALEKLLPLLHLEGIDFFSLQVDHGREQIRQLPETARLNDCGEHITDFADTAAFISELDLIITVDTAVAHLAGALGRPVWTLLPFVPDWRWGLSGDTTPWYPTMRLFRQSKAGDWPEVIARVTTALKEMRA